jgi:hypothetical protein
LVSILRCQTIIGMLSTVHNKATPDQSRMNSKLWAMHNIVTENVLRRITKLICYLVCYRQWYLHLT